MTTRPFTPIKLREGSIPKVAGQAAAQATAHAQDLCEPNAFAPLRQNNVVNHFTTGAKYFETLCAALKKAEKSIFIAGWQVNWDLELTPGERLIDILHQRLHQCEELRVYVLPWMSPKVGVNTFDLETMLAIFQLNAGLKNMRAMCCPAGEQSDFIGTEGAAFSHHQKMVVIDNKVAYVGGMDLAYGRLDDNSFSLDPGKRRFMERYNPGVPGAHVLSPQDGACLTMMDLLATTLTAGLWTRGGNSEPSALSKYLNSQMHRAAKHALEAVDLVNRAAKMELEADKAAISAGVRASASAVKASADVSARAVVASAHSVSKACADVQIPDVFGGLKIRHVGTQPTSGLSETVSGMEKGTVKHVNHAIDAIAGLSDFLAPLKRMRLDMTAYRMPSDVVIEDEKMLRSGLNTIIDVQAALIDSAEPVAEGAQYACVKISAGAEYAANLENAAIQKGADLAVAATDEMLASVNVFQRALIEEINNVREAVTKTLLRGLEEAISQVQQKDWQAVIHAFMRLVKRAYIAQLYVAWADAKAHPLLMKKGTKAAPLAGVLGPTQPREPWQDVHVEIQGPAVDDVARNFIGRWNAAQKSYLAEADDQFKPIGPDIISGLVRIPPQLVPPQRRQGGGPPTGVAVRVLRSAPLKLCKDEARARGDVLMPGSGQQEIQTQMLNLIQGATDFVYIENQFFQTFFDKASFDVFDAIGEQRYSGAMKYMMSSPANQLKCRLSSAGNATGARLRPQNKIGEALGNRIAEAVRHGMPFHVYIVLPVHPEGGLNDVLIAGQVHWTMQSLVFGEHSLVNRVRRAIAAKRLCKRPLSKPEWEKALADAGKRAGNVAPYEQVTEEQWSKYLTLLNLRNCQIVGGVVRTEQIYIHSKLLIVDDRHVLLGSANINDRSLSGHRDSELAVMLFDSKQVQKPLRDHVTHVNDLARNLRMDLWKKHFAIGLGDGIVSAATEMIPLMETPAAEATIKAIQKLASRNADIYAKTFAHVPWSKTVNGKGDGASLWPVCPRNATPDDADRLAKQMPFHAEFWKSQVRIKAPQGLRGFFTQLPTDWTIAENNHPPHMSVMALT